jgi:hypothetical protein
MWLWWSFNEANKKCIFKFSDFADGPYYVTRHTTHTQTSSSRLYEYIKPTNSLSSLSNFKSKGTNSAHIAK